MFIILELQYTVYLFKVGSFFETQCMSVLHSYILWLNRTQLSTILQHTGWLNM